MIRVGVVGVGSMGQNHARLYSELECQLIGVSDIDAEKGQSIAQKYNTTFYPDYHDLLGKVDAVSIVVPTSLHHQVALEFLSSGIHCLVEKPITDKLSKADEMIAAAEASGAKLAVGHIENFNPAVQKLKQLINEGVLGELIMVSARRVGPLVPRIRDVGIVVDNATHDIGVINYLAGGTPYDIYTKVGRLRHEISDHALIVLDYGRLFASIEVNWFTPHKVRTLVATGSEGIVYLDYINQTILFQNKDTEYFVDVKKKEPLVLELKDFLESITNNGTPLVDGYKAKDILQIALESTDMKASDI